MRTDPPRPSELRASRDSISRAVAELMPPPAQHALATGGTARALRKLVGATLGPTELDEALATLSRCRAREISARFAVPEWRAILLPAGTLMLSEIQRLLGKPLTVSRGGVREGAALELLTRAAAAA
jgi:exopolyphosphatase/pppGpp-phosphohydrolase